MLPLVRRRGEVTAPVDERTRFTRDDEVTWLLLSEQVVETRTWLEQAGWEPVARLREAQSTGSGSTAKSV
jgi:hypothetical protein